MEQKIAKGKSRERIRDFLPGNSPGFLAAEIYLLGLT
jgi:hypothetical protein